MVVSEVTKPEFLKEIFSAELKEITGRRETRGLEPPDTSGPPSAKKNLIGLALSGGGIRSATFSLGVVQALINEDKFKLIDYISTVSGGGYIGSCISSNLNRPGTDESFYAHKSGEADTPTVIQLRNSSNYLTPRGLFNKLRLPTMVLRGIFLNLFLLVPSLVLAVFLTEIINETWEEIINETWHWGGTVSVGPVVILLPFIIMTYLFAFVRRKFDKKLTWDNRDAYELNLDKLFAITIGVLALIPIMSLVRYSVDSSWVADVSERFDITSMENGLLKAASLIGALVPYFVFFNRIQNLSSVAALVLKYVVGVVGLLIVFAIYLGFCIFFVDSPYFLQNKKYLHILEGIKNGVCEETRKECKDLKDALVGKGLVKSIETPTQITVNKFPDVDGKRNWEIGYQVDNSQKTVIVTTKKNGALFIPELSILELLREPNKLGWNILKNLDQRIQWKFYLAGVLIFIFNLIALDVNITSAHGFYRDRLSKAFLFRQNDDGSISTNDDQKLSSLNEEGTVAPYHLINAAMNLPNSKNPNLRGRNADFFTISKCYSGSEHTGYCETKTLEVLDSRFNLGTAMAVSAAAAAPNMGAQKIEPFVFISTMLNVRLGYWIPNPLRIEDHKRRGKWRWNSVGPRYLLKEAFRKLDDVGFYVNLSDGGHIENLAIYQLLKRHCKLIVGVDGEADPNMFFKGLATLTRYAEIDLGVTIDMNLDQIRKDSDGISKCHWSVGTIHYGRDEVGYLLYLKLSLTGDESEYLRAYRRENPTFPHQTITDQFFDEAQFEEYRALGEHIGAGALAGLGEGNQDTDLVLDEIKKLLQIPA